MDEWVIQPLERSHLRHEFCCGSATLDDFIRSLATQYERRRLGRTFVAVRPGEARVHGYYTLASSSLSFENVPSGAAKKLPRHPVPVALLARLVVDRPVQARGLGKLLLIDALHRCLLLADQLGIHAVEVDAIDHEAQGFYRSFGFIPLVDSELHLFLPLRTIEDAFKSRHPKA